MRTTTRPRLLLVEDDAVSAAFLGDVLRALPADVDVAGSVGAAMAVADAGQALWLFDRWLPDGNGIDLLRALRRLGLDVPALALTADADAPARAAFSAAGFSGVLAKPVAAAVLQAEVRRWLDADTVVADDDAKTLAFDAHAALPAWDDTAARAALGDDTLVARMRTLFLAELPVQHADVLAASRHGRPDEARAVLHRMKAGCGFVGATALLAAVRTLSEAPGCPRARADFDHAALALLPPR